MATLQKSGVTKFPPKYNFASLSVKDLLDARDAYHLHLAHLENVVATAIGRYRIIQKDPDETNPEVRRHGDAPAPPTLLNSVVTPWSWPCVMVFVKEWVASTGFHHNPDQAVPPFLYLPDGRVAPTCVILVEEREYDNPGPTAWHFPTGTIGGGYPVLTPVQNADHVGSVACLVTDGKRMYALTNHHVAGVKDDRADSLFNGVRRLVGKSAGKSVGKCPFSDAYRGWAGTNTLANLDAGLIEVEDVHEWTTQIYGIGPLGQPIDVNTHTITLDLIGCRVRAFGCAGGLMLGQIAGLFYRYKSIGGTDYTADLLIAPREATMPLTTAPGDSGTLWVYDPPDDEIPQTDFASPLQFRPLAVQWGGHALTARGETCFRLALATCLSTICRELDVGVVRGWNISNREYWGKTGHYKIAALSCELVRNKNLRAVMEANRDNIAYDDDTLRKGKKLKVDADVFVPLADVPDYVWVPRRKRGKDICFYDHFVDMDERGKGKFAGKSLLSLCDVSDPDLDPKRWNDYYDSLGTDDVKRGKLPFRVWQVYDAMVDYLQESKLAEFVCSAGVLAHYVGDACQPLHLSRLSHGYPGTKSRVHPVVDQTMIEQNVDGFIDRMNEQTGRRGARPGDLVKGGYAAALAVVRLMCSTIKKLPPEKVVDRFDEVQGRGQAKALWNKIGTKVGEVMSDSCRCLALLWDSAWSEGGGDKLDLDSRTLEIPQDYLKDLYLNKSFLPDHSLRELAEHPNLLSKKLNRKSPSRGALNWSRSGGSISFEEERDNRYKIVQVPHAA